MDRNSSVCSNGCYQPANLSVEFLCCSSRFDPIGIGLGHAITNGEAVWKNSTELCESEERDTKEARTSVEVGMRGCCDCEGIAISRHCCEALRSVDVSTKLTTSVVFPF